VPTIEIAPRIHRIDSRMNTRLLSQWLVVGDDATLLFDTGIAGTVREHVEPALAELGIAPARLAEVVISHADVDHYGGNAEIRALASGARLRAHRLDRPLIESWALIAAERYGWYRRHQLDYPPEAWEWLEAAAGVPVELDEALEPGESIDLGGIALEVLHLPGHSRGHLGLVDRAGATAIIADAVMGFGFETLEGCRAGPPPYLDLETYRETIEVVRELGVERLGTAHFPLFEGAAIGRFCDRSRELTDRIERAIDRQPALDGDPVAALLDPVARALGGYPEMEVELARSIGAHLELRRALTSRV
jgi:glyoxylase-like metal-dependent hydrolase (beta-lactamase superfamily II)